MSRPPDTASRTASSSGFEEGRLAGAYFLDFVAVLVHSGDVVADSRKARGGYATHISETEDSDMVLLFCRETHLPQYRRALVLTTVARLELGNSGQVQSTVVMFVGGVAYT